METRVCAAWALGSNGDMGMCAAWVLRNNGDMGVCWASPKSQPPDKPPSPLRFIGKCRGYEVFGLNKKVVFVYVKMHFLHALPAIPLDGSYMRCCMSNLTLDECTSGGRRLKCVLMGFVGGFAYKNVLS